ncbi:dnaJ homolog subfamily C member 30, mitochondrial-like [Microplitis mediator]|uniref:dnaJ homolog subfamily C member 30, mitochondrial-like n=1 Tax=Microplitis mediator TaxID=375433 RepID=UPI002555E7C5|nr:dnaJ homolog subfamily C member 30, mitochondrial-like [Microplitis mediator]
MKIRNMAYNLRMRWIFKFYDNKLFSSKVKTHYDNLEIKTKATQGEIKSAYFKLSMQYHPDKNSSEEAKIKFRDISEAYEVLGNYDTRKQYDRKIKVRSPVDQPREHVIYKPADISKEAHRAHMEIMRRKTQHDGTPIFDFDAWTKAHYGQTFAKTRKTKIKYKMYTDAKQEAAKNSYSAGVESALLMVFITATFSMVVFGLLLPSESDILDDLVIDKKKNDSDDDDSKKPKDST